MQSVEDSARPMSMADGEDILLGTTDESKASNEKGPTVGPSTSNIKRNEQNADEQEENALKKKKKGGRQPYTNTVKYISHDNYNIVRGDTKQQRYKRL